MTFEEVVLECCKTPELIKEFDRLQDSNLQRVLIAENRPPIVQMIDEATGYKRVLDEQTHIDMQKFISFCFKCVWLPLLNALDNQRGN
jgi:hypothetical protein